MTSEKNVNSPLTLNMIRYAWKEITQRAGLRELVPNTSPLQSSSFSDEKIASCGAEMWGGIFLDKQVSLDGLPIAYGNPNEITFEQPGIIIEPTGVHAFLTILTTPENSLNWVKTSELMPEGSPCLTTTKTPILFWGKSEEQKKKRCVTYREDGTIVFYIDIIAATIFMLTRWEEIVSTRQRDEHNRFPAAASVAYKQRFLDRPIVDEYALILQAWARQLCAAKGFQWQPKVSKFSIKLSHDIDWVTNFSSTQKGMRQTVADIAKRNSLSLALTSQKKLWADLLKPASTTQMKGIQMLADFSEEIDLKSSFYFKASTYSEQDSGYNPAAHAIKQSIRRLIQRGHEIGFHPGYDTYNNLILLKKEKAVLENALQDILVEPLSGGRQHYLRFTAPGTWRHWAQAGMHYDSTVGFAEHCGFRCGTCHPFRVFDYENDHELDLVEVPLIVMDTTLRYYETLSIERAHQRIVEYAKKCRAVNGTFTLLWHNTSLSDTWLEWGRQYPLILQDLAKLM